MRAAAASVAYHLTKLGETDVVLYSELEAEVGLSTGFKRWWRHGGSDEGRMTQLRRTAVNAEAFDLECQLLSPKEALDRSR